MLPGFLFGKMSVILSVSLVKCVIGAYKNTSGVALCALAVYKYAAGVINCAVGA